MVNKRIACACILLSAMWLGGCESAPRTDAHRQALEQDVQLAIGDFVQKDPTIQALFDESPGYAVFPVVTQGAVGIGGAHGWGMVFDEGEPIGYAELSQGTLGTQLGGEEYRQVIFFENESALRRFMRGQFALAARLG